MMKWIIVVVFLAFLGLYSGRAVACCGDGPIAAQGAISAGSTVSSTISTATSTVTQWLQKIDNTIQGGFGKLYGEIQRQTAEQRVMHQGMIAVETQRYMQKVSADAKTTYQVSPRACFETAAGAAATAAANETAQSVNDLNRIAAERTLFTPNTAAAVHQLVDAHYDRYCSKQDAALGRCTAAPEAMQNADVRTDTLLSHTTLDADQLAAARELAKNLVNPMPTQNLPKNLEDTHAGKMFIAGQYIEQAALSVAQNNINQAIAIRTPVKGLGTAAMMSTPDISELALMEAQVRGRFESPKWYAMIAGMSQANLLREMNKQMALKLWMDLKTFKQQERIEVALGTMLAANVREHAAEKLSAARDTALRSSR